MLKILLLITTVTGQDLTSVVDVKTLSELPLNKLLKVKNNFEFDGNDLERMSLREEFIPNIPNAMALRGKQKPYNRGDWEEEQKGKGKGVQSIFQMSITTLAFLAFGGYLLCMVVQSLKDKGGKKVYMMMPMIYNITITTTAPARRRRRRPAIRIRRPARLKREADDLQTDTYEEPSIDMMPHVDPEKMFDALVTLSEAYTRYHTVDYKRFNQTISPFI